MFGRRFGRWPTSEELVAELGAYSPASRLVGGIAAKVVHSAIDRKDIGLLAVFASRLPVVFDRASAAGWTPREHARNSGIGDVVDRLLSERPIRGVDWDLFFAARRGNVRAARRALDAGARVPVPDLKGYPSPTRCALLGTTAVHAAVEERQVGVLKLLAERVPEAFEYKSRAGSTARELAYRVGIGDVVDRLLAEQPAAAAPVRSVSRGPGV